MSVYVDVNIYQQIINIESFICFKKLIIEFVSVQMNVLLKYGHNILNHMKHHNRYF